MDSVVTQLRLRRTDSMLRLRRTWPQRVVIVGGIGLVVVCLVAAWGLADAYNSVGEIPREALPDGVLSEQPGDPGGPRNILLIGSTENAGIDADDPLRAGREDTSLADTIMVLRVEPATRKAILLTINRDLYVPEGPWAFKGRINGAYSSGGTETLIRVIREYLHIEINDFVKVNFAGFRTLIDEIDGVPVYFEHPMKDDGSGFSADGGCTVLDGAMALNYVRSRKMQADRDGDGRFDPADGWSDRDRTERQRDFLLLTMQRAIDKGARDPRTLRGMIGAVNAEGAVVLDEKLTPDHLIDISQAFGDFTPDSLQRYSIVTVDSVLNGSKILRLNEADTQPYIDLINGRGDTTGNADVHVDVVEARAPGDRDGDAAPPAGELRDKGFKVTEKSAREADRRSRTTITYSADQDVAALKLARNLATRPVFEPVTGSARLTLHVGTDWTGLTLVPLPEEEFAGAIPSVAAPTTTSAPGPTATAPAEAAPTALAGVRGADHAGGLCDPDR